MFTSLMFMCCIEPALVAKSNIILDVKPWDDETGTYIHTYTRKDKYYVEFARMMKCVVIVKVTPRNRIWGSQDLVLNPYVMANYSY